MCAKRYRSDAIVGQGRPRVYAFASFRRAHFRIVRETRRFPDTYAAGPNRRPEARRPLCPQGQHEAPCYRVLGRVARSAPQRPPSCSATSSNGTSICRARRSGHECQTPISVYTLKTYLFQTNRIFVQQPAKRVFGGTGGWVSQNKTMFD